MMTMMIMSISTAHAMKNCEELQYFSLLNSINSHFKTLNQLETDIKRITNEKLNKKT